MRSLCRCLNMQSSASENRRPRKRFLYDVRGRASSSDHRFYLPSTNSEMSRMAANAPSYSSTIDEDVDVAHRRLTGLAAALPFALACYGRNQQLFASFALRYVYVRAMYWLQPWLQKPISSKVCVKVLDDRSYKNDDLLRRQFHRCAKLGTGLFLV